MPRTSPWSPFRVRVRTVARTVMHFRSKRRKGQKTGVGRRRERERERRSRERSVDVRVAKNQCILCSDPSRFLSSNVVPSGRTIGRAMRILVNVLSGGSSSLFFKHLFFARPVVRVYHVLYLVCSRIRLRVSHVTASGACNVHVCDCISGLRTENIDNFFDACQRITFHTF